MNFKATLESEDGKICINGILHDKKDMYNALLEKEKSEMFDYYDNIVDAGNVLIKLGQTKAVEYAINKAFSEMLNNMQEKFTEIISKSVEGNISIIPEQLNTKMRDIINIYMESYVKTIPNTIDEQFEKGAEQLEDKLNEKTSELKDDFDKKITSLEQHIDDELNLNKPGSLSTIKRDIENLKRKIDYKSDRENTTGKGFDFEEKFVNILNKITLRGSDNYEITKNKAGKNKDTIHRDYFKGDFVVQLYEISKFNRIVIETKNVNDDAARYTVSNTTEELDLALRNRDASFAIMVFEKDIPNKLNGSSYLGPDKLVCTLNEFPDVYDKAKLRLLKRYYDELELRLNTRIISIQRENIKQRNPELINYIINSKKDIDECIIKINEIDNIRKKIRNSIQESINSMLDSTDELTGYRDNLFRKLAKAQTTIQSCLQQYVNKESNDRELISQKDVISQNVEQNQEIDISKPITTEQADVESTWF